MYLLILNKILDTYCLRGCRIAPSQIWISSILLINIDKYTPKCLSTTELSGLRNMEGFLQADFPWGAAGVSLSGTFCCFPPQSTASAEAPALLHQLLSWPPPSRAPPYCGCNQLLYSGYRRSNSHCKLFIYKFTFLDILRKLMLLSLVLLSLEGKGPLHFGLCSNWLNTIKEGDTVPCFLHRYPSFYIAFSHEESRRKMSFYCLTFWSLTFSVLRAISIS